MQVAFYSPYLDTLGGGEKYLLDIALAAHQLGYKTVIFWKNKEIKHALVDRYGDKYGFVDIDTLWHTSGRLDRINKTRQFDAFFYQPDGSYFFSLASKNFALLQVPNKNLLPRTGLLNSIKASRWTPVFNSHFTKRFFLKYLKPKQHFVLYPTISEEFFTKTKTAKEKIILSVGRFFSHLHSKKQDFLIKTYISAKKKYKEFADYKLVLLGNLKPEDNKYFAELEKLAKNDSHIIIKTNVPFSTILSYYQQASFYWHAAGYKINERKEPEKAEHFGISIIEAMAAGAVPLAYKAGGPKEIILQQKTGYLFENRAELINYTYKLIKDHSNRYKLATAAQQRAEEKFGFKSFQNRLKQIL